MRRGGGEEARRRGGEEVRNPICECELYPPERILISGQQTEIYFKIKFYLPGEEGWRGWGGER